MEQTPKTGPDLKRTRLRSATTKVGKWLVVVVVTAALFRVLVYDWYSMPAGPMKDSIRAGDILLVNKMAYGYSRHACPWSLCSFGGRVFGRAPERGDIAVFKHPLADVHLALRIVGLPGERIQLRDGVLQIDGTPVPTEATGYFEEPNEPQGRSRGLPQCENRPVKRGETCLKRRYIETLPGGSAHSILDIGHGPGDDTAEVVVPTGEYFLLGDHRDISLDSRHKRTGGGLGTVPFENLIGRVDATLFPLGDR